MQQCHWLWEQLGLELAAWLQGLQQRHGNLPLGTWQQARCLLSCSHAELVQLLLGLLPGLLLGVLLALELQQEWVHMTFTGGEKAGKPPRK